MRSDSLSVWAIRRARLNDAIVSVGHVRTRAPVVQAVFRCRRSSVGRFRAWGANHTDQLIPGEPTVSMSISTSASLNRTAVERLLRLPGGLVDRNMRRRVDRAIQVARRDAPGSMSARLSASFERTARGPQGTITLHHPAALYVTRGTRPHEIRPVRAQALRFVVGGRVVYASIVHHPGNAPNDFMVRALRTAVR